MQNFRYASQDLRTRGHKVNISRSNFLVVKGKYYAHAEPSYTSQSFRAHAPRFQRGAWSLRLGLFKLKKFSGKFATV